MRRSQINAAIRRLLELAAERRFPLPPWAEFTPRQWARLGPEGDEVRLCALGWDVTDFGSGDFPACGLTLLTLRNGPPTARRGQEKDYCEKIMLVGEDQHTPFHFHFSKMEDIINRGGGKLVLKMFHSTPVEDLDPAAEVTVQVDGFTRRLPPGGELLLEPGESVSLPPRLYHEFWGLGGREAVLVGEVSRVNDDTRDNRFLRPLPRFPAIEEDEPARFVLCNEYARLRG